MNQKELVIFVCAQVLKEHEGVRFTPYNDSLGHCTVGVGHLLHKGSCTKEEFSTLYSKSQIAGYLDRDLEVAYKDAVQWLGKESFDGLSAIWQVALVCMSFQLGANTMGQFVMTRQAIIDRDVAKVCSHIRKSRWHQQTPKRTEFICAILENNSWKKLN